MIIDPNEYYWLVIEFVDVDETTTTQLGELYYYPDPDDSDTDSEWVMAKKVWYDVVGDWTWDTSEEDEDGWFAVWGEPSQGQEGSVSHGGGANNKDMLFGVYICGD